MKLLIYTSALVAALLRDEANHAAAVEFLRESPQARFLLTDLILAETVTLLRMRVGAARAVAVAHDLRRSRRYEIVFLDRDLLAGALEQMKRYADKRLSLADCASFEVMERFRLAAAFTFDQDFRACGFDAAPAARH